VFLATSYRSPDAVEVCRQEIQTNRSSAKADEQTSIDQLLADPFYNANDNAASRPLCEMFFFGLRLLHHCQTDVGVCSRQAMKR
jgi:hypothetical protein